LDTSKSLIEKNTVSFQEKELRLTPINARPGIQLDDVWQIQKTETNMTLHQQHPNQLTS
jgi:hypothetical protein